MTSKAQYRATKKYESKHYDRVLVLLPKGTKKRIQETGDSVNGFIKSAVLDRLKYCEPTDEPTNEPFYDDP